MDSKTKQKGIQKRRRYNTVTSNKLVEICRNFDVEAGTWIEFSTEKLWKKAVSPPPTTKVKIKLASINDPKPRRVNVTAGHRPIISQAVITPDQSNIFSIQIGQILEHGDKIRLKIDASRIFRWKVSIAIMVEEKEEKGKPRRQVKERESPTPGSRFCLKCGALTLLEAKFCHRCGANIQSDNTT
jgi:hypothetical protein